MWENQYSCHYLVVTLCFSPSQSHFTFKALALFCGRLSILGKVQFLAQYLFKQDSPSYCLTKFNCKIVPAIAYAIICQGGMTNS